MKKENPLGPSGTMGPGPCPKGTDGQPIVSDCPYCRDGAGHIHDVLGLGHRAPELLSQGAKTFRERNAVYGDSYLTLGAALAGMFPNGLTIKSGDVAAFQRLGAFIQIVNKCCRYATPLANGGGHQDSARDMMVYAAMLEEVTRNEP